MSDQDDIARMQRLLADEAGEPPRHLTYDDLAAWVDGERRSEVEEHLAECDLCRDEAADLARLREAMKPRRNWTWYALAAAAVLALVVALALLRRPHPPTQPPPIVRETPPSPAPKPPERITPPAPAYARAEWAQLVASALASGRLPYPADLALLRGGREAVRGEDEDDPVRLRPRGVVIDDVRPVFSWPPTPGASFVVSIFERDREVAHSELLTASRWTPPEPLARGRTYIWQVEVKSDGTTIEVLPAPPSRPARFRIASAADHDEIAAARREHPSDPLLLATLYAKAGMEAEARAALRQLAASADPKVQRLLANARAE